MTTGQTAPATGRPDSIFGHHMNVYASGVARFNALLGRHLQIPVFNVFDDDLFGIHAPLLSFKASEMTADEIRILAKRLDLIANRPLYLFLHDYTGLPVEQKMVEQAVLVFCGNDEVLARVRPVNAKAHVLWAPGQISDSRPLEDTPLMVFSFGMAHKIRVDMFERLRDLLRKTGVPYSVYFSNATHETSSVEDTESVFNKMTAIFPERLFFMGNLSDVAVSHYLNRATYFATFFENGVRANNTSVVSALEHNAVIISNLDQYSPDYYVHLENMIDINQCETLPDDPALLARMRDAAHRTAETLTWQHLTAKMHSLTDERPVGAGIRHPAKRP